MARNFKQEAFAENEQRASFRRWIEARAEAVRDSISVYDVLGRNGVILKGDGREEQISCPFHGADNKPSCRVYPESVRGPSGAWCFVCQERWDAIALWRKYSGSEIKFTRVLAEMEKAFGILPPESPPPLQYEDDPIDPDMLEVDKLFDLCETRLKGARGSFDMVSYLTIGSILDRLDYQVNEGKTSFVAAKGILNKVKDKIGAKVRGG